MMKRNRIFYATAVIAVMTLGILSRQYPDWLPACLGKYPGDALWAFMIFCGVGFLRPRATTIFLVVAAFTFCCGIEFAKLYHAPWMDSVRATLLGRLVFGQVFSWNNLAAYAVGILFGGLIETGFSRWQKKRN